MKKLIVIFSLLISQNIMAQKDCDFRKLRKPIKNGKASLHQNNIM